MFSKINNLLALIVVVGIPLLVAMAGVLSIPLPEIAVGAFIAGWTLVIQFFFRKAEPKT